MITPQLVEGLLSGLVLDDEACNCYPELGRLRARALGWEAETIHGVARQQSSWQWALCTCNLPLARGLLRHAARSLLELLDALNLADEASTQDDCYVWHALRLAPPWLPRPAEPDDEEPDIALLLERDELWNGDWLALIEDLHRAGSERWQWAIQRCRAMQRFERAYGVNLRQLLEPTEAGPPKEAEETMEETEDRQRVTAPAR